MSDATLSYDQLRTAERLAKLNAIPSEKFVRLAENAARGGFAEVALAAYVQAVYSRPTPGAAIPSPSRLLDAADAISRRGVYAATSAELLAAVRPYMDGAL